LQRPRRDPKWDIFWNGEPADLLIFLDFDGVVNCQAWYIEVGKEELARRGPRDDISEALIERLNDIVEETGAKIVVSSTWRKGEAIEDLQGDLDRHGFRGRVIGKTPTIPMKVRKEKEEAHEVRGYEITMWLAKHPEFEGTPFIILDDESDMGPWMSHLVQTTWKRGLEEEHVAEAIRRLTT